MTRTSSPENAAQSRFSGLWEGDAAAPDPGAIIAEASNAGRDKAFRRERKRRARAMPRIQHETAAELGRLFRRADRELRAELRAGDSDFTAWLAPQQRRRITELLDALGTEAGQRLVSGQDRSWDAGIASVDAPINAALELGAAHGASGAAIGDHLVQPDLRQLGAMRTFLTGKMKQVTAQTINRVNTQIGLVALGVHSAGDGVSAISKVLGSTRKRAITILRTELGRAYATAAQERQAQAVAVLPGLRKQWRRSGKLHSRLTHDAADGQIREVDKPFDVGGVELMYPRDPAAPAGETINCGCESLSYMESWETAGTLLDARARAFTEREIAARPMRAELGSAPAAPAAAPPAADDEPVTVRAPVPRVGQLPPDPERERRTARSQVARVRTLLARGDIDQARDMVHTITHGSAFDRGNKHGWPVGISPGGCSTDWRSRRGKGWRPKSGRRSRGHWSSWTGCGRPSLPGATRRSRSASTGHCNARSMRVSCYSRCRHVVMQGARRSERCCSRICRVHRTACPRGRSGSMR